jgi:hypothetical protein
MVGSVARKSQILEEGGYSYNFHHMVYVNRPKKKVFSIQFIDDHREDEIQSRIDQETNGDWTFYFNEEPPRAVRRELESVLG